MSKVTKLEVTDALKNVVTVLVGRFSKRYRGDSKDGYNLEQVIKGETSSQQLCLKGLNPNIRENGNRSET